MINLEELSKMANEAIAKETKESLTTWLLERRKLAEKRNAEADAPNHKAIAFITNTTELSYSGSK